MRNEQTSFGRKLGAALQLLTCGRCPFDATCTEKRASAKQGQSFISYKRLGQRGSEELGSTVPSSFESAIESQKRPRKSPRTNCRPGVSPRKETLDLASTYRLVLRAKMLQKGVLTKERPACCIRRFAAVFDHRKGFSLKKPRTTSEKRASKFLIRNR